MVAQGEDLHEALAAEYHYEYHVEVVQHIAERLRLLVMIESHCEHVEPDEQHYEHIELLVRHVLEHYGLGSPLQNYDGMHW